MMARSAVSGNVMRSQVLDVDDLAELGRMAGENIPLRGSRRSEWVVAAEYRDWGGGSAHAAGRGSNVVLGEREMVATLVQDAFACLGNSDRLVARDAIDWIGAASEEPWGFGWCCALMGIDVEAAMREAARRWAVRRKKRRRRNAMQFECGSCGEPVEIGSGIVPTHIECLDCRRAAVEAAVWVDYPVLKGLLAAGLRFTLIAFALGALASALAAYLVWVNG